MRHLILTLESPLMAFGGETIDNYGVIRDFPSASMIAGLLANALGWRRIERENHQRLQDRLIFAVRIDRERTVGGRLTDFQTAQLGAGDRGWTTRGQPERRAGGANTYNAPHLRYRDYHSDMRVTVALRLDSKDDAPTLDDIAAALDEPARPLFIGRKPCLPSEPLFAGYAEGDTTLAALMSAPLSESPTTGRSIRMLWPAGEGVRDIPANRTYSLTDERNWISGLHGGGRLVSEGSASPDMFTHSRDDPSEKKG